MCFILKLTVKTNRTINANYLSLNVFKNIYQYYTHTHTNIHQHRMVTSAALWYDSSMETEGAGDKQIFSSRPVLLVLSSRCREEASESRQRAGRDGEGERLLVVTRCYGAIVSVNSELCLISSVIYWTRDDEGC